MTDFIIVLRTTDAVKTFSGNVHLSIGAGLSAAVGNEGRAAEADLRAGDGGYAACYTYSCSKGAFHSKLCIYLLKANYSSSLFPLFIFFGSSFFILAEFYCL